MGQLVNKTELARIAGVTKAAITKAAVKQFPHAFVGPLIDLQHPDVTRYLENKDQASTRAAERLLAPSAPPPAPRPVQTVAAPAAPRPLRPPPTGVSAPAPQAPVQALPALPLPPSPNDDDDIERYADLSLRHLTTIFGTAVRFGEWLKARKSIADIRDKNLKYAERVGLLIQRDYVRTHVFSYLDTLHRRLLVDGARTIARRTYALALGGVPVEEAEAEISATLGKMLGEAKLHALRALPDNDSDEQSERRGAA